MSAVSSGSARGNAELHESVNSTPDETAGHAPADFGANEWLVEELYQQYLADPSSVDRAWWSFFADFRPALGNNGASGNGDGVQPDAHWVAQDAPAPAAPAQAPAAPRPAPSAP